MSRILVLFLAIAFAAATVAQQSAVQPQQKTIKNPAEYNSYISAISQQHHDRSQQEEHCEAMSAAEYTRWSRRSQPGRAGPRAMPEPLARAAQAKRAAG